MTKVTNLTKFEITKIIGIRANQLCNGAPPQVNISDLDDAYKIAEREFEQKRIPFIIKRKYPDGKICQVNANTGKIIK